MTLYCAFTCTKVHWTLTSCRYINKASAYCTPRIRSRNIYPSNLPTPLQRAMVPEDKLLMFSSSSYISSRSSAISSANSSLTSSTFNSTVSTPHHNSTAVQLSVLWTINTWPRLNDVKRSCDRYFSRLRAVTSLESRTQRPSGDILTICVNDSSSIFYIFPFFSVGNLKILKHSNIWKSGMIEHFLNKIWRRKNMSNINIFENKFLKTNLKIWKNKKPSPV